MRKFLRILLLTAVLAGALCVSALAAEPTEAGVYGMTTETASPSRPRRQMARPLMPAPRVTTLATTPAR